MCSFDDAPRFAYGNDDWYSLRRGSCSIVMASQQSDDIDGANRGIDEVCATIPGEVMMRQMRETCSSANWNSTSCMGFLLMAL